MAYLPIRVAPVVPVAPVDALLAVGLKDLWYPICPSGFVKERPISLRRLGKKIAIWRDAHGTLHALEDHCPHRGAPLSQGVVLGDRLACPYHGVEVRCDGTVTKVPGSPGCKLEGARAALSFHVQEACGAIFLYNSDTNLDEAPPPLQLPEELSSPEYSNFLCYTEWKGDYRYVLDNVMDPMHGTFLHKQSHSMAEGDSTAQFQIRDTDTGFVFEKVGQRGVNFDWTEWASTDWHWLRLEIPYPKTGGPGGSFAIVGSYTPINEQMAAVFHWRCRRVSGWLRDTWRFLYRNRLEARHWQVLEQDRAMLEFMELDANQHEHLYQHDIGVTRLRRHLKKLAKEQIDQATPVRVDQGHAGTGRRLMPSVAVERVHVPGVVEPAGATWSNALRIGDEVVMSGVTAHSAAGLDTYTQAMRVLRRLLATVDAAGGDIRSFYKLVIYVTDIADKEAIGQARRDFFVEPPYPCSTLVEVKGLVFPELTVEIDAWARLDVDLSLCR